MLPNFALICPIVDAHFNALNPMSHRIHMIQIHRARFLCAFIHWILSNANAMIPPMNAVLESVSMIAIIHSAITAIFSIVFLFAVKRFFIEVSLCLKKRTMIGRNAIRKYP